MDLYLSDSDWDSSSDSGMEDQEEVDFLYGGHAQSILSSLEQSIEKIDDFLSFERGFMHGDTVFSVNDPSGQMGRVVGIDMVVDLENVFGKTIKGVNSKNLLKTRSFSVGDYVVGGPWIGRVEKVIDRITIVFDDGTKYEVNAMDQDKILPITPNILEDAQYPYYPGQRVKVKLSTGSKSARWLCSSWKENQDEGTVCAVETGLVYIDWITSVLTVTNPDLPSPPRLLDSQKLTLLPCFLHANWQLGDWCKLPLSGHNGDTEGAFSGTSTVQFNNKNKNVESVRRNLCSSVEEIFEITKTKTKVDIVWQDGSISLGLESQMLLPTTVVNSYEFWPEQFVLEKGTCDDPHVSGSHKWGFVLGMDAKERTVKVQWTTLATAKTKYLNSEKMTETVSAYELVEHPDYSYCFGDLVFKLVQNNYDDQSDTDHLKEGVNFEENDLEGKCFGNDQSKFPDKYYLSCIGSVVGLKHGAVEVKWATGITSKVAPSKINHIDKNEKIAEVSEDEDGEDLNEEMIQHDKQSSMDTKDFLNSNGVGGGCKKHLWESTSFFLPQAAIGFFTNIATSLLRASGSTALSGSTLVHVPEAGSKSEVSSAIELMEESNACTERKIDALDTLGEECFNQDVEQITQDKAYSVGNKSSDRFKQFDMVRDCPDHHFLSSTKGFSLSQVKRTWMKKVQQEWSILEKNLPDTIYVRIFEERMDLIRAAIIGAPGTPYHDGLFLFDIYLPPEYPYEPPMVHYNSGGLRLNPNLYESGKICLSLLNTWAGSDTEVWNPESSTILQVLLSLQALVLNEKPYFNEAGYDQQVGKAEGEKNSVSYNENAYLATCKSMLYLLRKPAKHFEDLVVEHFRQRAQHILMACKAYMEGAPVGCVVVGFDKTEHDQPKGSSTGFKIMLSKLFPKLVEAFSEKGIDCSQIAIPEEYTGAK